MHLVIIPDLDLGDISVIFLIDFFKKEIYKGVCICNY